MATYAQAVVKLGTPSEAKLRWYYIAGKSPSLITDYYMRLRRTISMPPSKVIEVDFSAIGAKVAEIESDLFTVRPLEPHLYVLKGLKDKHLPIVRQLMKFRGSCRDWIILIHPGNPRKSPDPDLFRMVAEKGRYIDANPFTDTAFHNFLEDYGLNEQEREMLLTRLGYDVDAVLEAGKLIEHLGKDNVDLIPDNPGSSFIKMLTTNPSLLMDSNLNPQDFKRGMSRLSRMLFLGKVLTIYGGDLWKVSESLEVPIFWLTEALQVWKIIDASKLKTLLDAIIVVEARNFQQGSLHYFLAVWSSVTRIV